MTDSPVSEDPAKYDKYSASYWLAELKRSKKDFSDFEQLADESNEVYKNRKKLDGVDRRMGIWPAIINTILPAYYSNLPKVEANLRKKIGDKIHTLSAQALENGTQYALDEEIPFDSVAEDAVRQFLIAGLGVFWARFHVKTEKESASYGLMRSEDGGLYDVDGNLYEGDESEVLEGEQGLYVETEIERVVEERAVLESVHYRDYRQTPARQYNEITWKARRAYMTKQEVKDLFPEGSDFAEKLKYDTLPADVKKLARDDNNVTHLYKDKAEIWEIWCKESGMVYWVCDSGEGGVGPVIEKSEPPINFHGFFPCVELSANLELNSAVPFGDYKLAKDLIVEAERLTTRIQSVVTAIRTNFLYNSALGGDIEDLFSDDLKGIPCKNWPTHSSKGGISGQIEFINVDAYTKALGILSQQREATLGKLYEVLKISDLMRGASDPRESATAQDYKQRNIQFNFGSRQRKVERFFSDAIQKVAEIVAEQYSEAKQYEISGGQDLVGDPQNFMQVAELLRNEPGRRYRITVASDSLVQIDERAERQERVDLLSSIGSFLEQSVKWLEMYPGTSDLVPELLKYAVRSYKSGKELEDVFMGMLAAVQQQAQQKRGQEGQQDPKLIESQVKMQVAQLEAQVEQQKLQAEASKANIENQIKMQELQLKQQEMGLERDKLRLELAKLQGDQALAGLEFQRDTQKIQGQIAKERLDTEQELIKAASKPQPQFNGV